MWKCTIDFGCICKPVSVVGNNMLFCNKIKKYFKNQVYDYEKSPYEIMIVTKDSSSIFSGSFFERFETEINNELESLLHIIEVQIFQKGGYNNAEYLPLHGSAVSGKDDKALLIIGGTHAGKSTLILYLLEKGFSFIADDLVLVSKRDCSVNNYSRPLHIRENTLKLFEKYIESTEWEVERICNGTYFLNIDNSVKTNIKINSIFLIEFNEFENECLEMTGFEKLLIITKNIKGTNIDNWQSYINLFKDIKLFKLKYRDFQYVDENLEKGGVIV